jgi:hypothetical protein
MTAVRQFLRGNNRFVVDREMDKLLLTAAPNGYLHCVRNPRKEKSAVARRRATTRRTEVS